MTTEKEIGTASAVPRLTAEMAQSLAILLNRMDISTDETVVALGAIANESANVIATAELEALRRDAARAKRNAGKFAAALLGNILDEIEAEKGIDGMNWLMDEVEPELQAIANRLAGVIAQEKANG